MGSKFQCFKTKAIGSFVLYDDRKPIEFFCYEDERGYLDVFFKSRGRHDSRFIGWAASEVWAKQLAIDWYADQFGVYLERKQNKQVTA